MIIVPSPAVVAAEPRFQTVLVRGFGFADLISNQAGSLVVDVFISHSTLLVQLLTIASSRPGIQKDLCKGSVYACIARPKLEGL